MLCPHLVPPDIQVFERCSNPLFKLINLLAALSDVVCLASSKTLSNICPDVDQIVNG
jgi:hypothetical protein